MKEDVCSLYTAVRLLAKYERDVAVAAYFALSLPAMQEVITRIAVETKTLDRLRSARLRASEELFESNDDR